MSPSGLCLACSEAYRAISTFSFDPNLEPSPQNLLRGEAAGHLSRSLERHRHLLGGELRSSGMPHEGYADPITNDGPRFHSNMLDSELTEHVTRAIEASDVSSTPPVAKTMDRATTTTTSQPSTGPLLPAGARGKIELARRPNTRSYNDGSDPREEVHMKTRDALFY